MHEGPRGNSLISRTLNIFQEVASVQMVSTCMRDASHQRTRPVAVQTPTALSILIYRARWQLGPAQMEFLPPTDSGVSTDGERETWPYVHGDGAQDFSPKYQDHIQRIFKYILKQFLNMSTVLDIASKYNDNRCNYLERLYWTIFFNQSWYYIKLDIWGWLH